MGDVKMAQPIKVIRNGCCSASIFENKKQLQGKAVGVYKVVVQKSYKGKDGWKRTNNYDVNDLPKLFFVACKAYDYLTDKHKPQEEEPG